MRQQAPGARTTHLAEARHRGTPHVWMVGGHQPLQPIERALAADARPSRWPAPRRARPSRSRATAPARRRRGCACRAAPARAPRRATGLRRARPPAPRAAPRRWALAHWPRQCSGNQPDAGLALEQAVAQYLQHTLAKLHRVGRARLVACQHQVGGQLERDGPLLGRRERRVQREQRLHRLLPPARAAHRPCAAWARRSLGAPSWRRGTRCRAPRPAARRRRAETRGRVHWPARCAANPARARSARRARCAPRPASRASDRRAAQSPRRPRRTTCSAGSSSAANSGSAASGATGAPQRRHHHTPQQPLVQQRRELFPAQVCLAAIERVERGHAQERIAGRQPLAHHTLGLGSADSRQRLDGFAGHVRRRSTRPPASAPPAPPDRASRPALRPRTCERARAHSAAPPPAHARPRRPAPRSTSSDALRRPTFSPWQMA